MYRDIQNTRNNLIPDKTLNVLIYGTPSYFIILYKTEMVQFFGQPCIARLTNM